MAGVRGFSDPNVQVNPNGKTTFQQFVSRFLYLVSRMNMHERQSFVRSNISLSQKGHVELDHR